MADLPGMQLVFQQQRPVLSLEHSGTSHEPGQNTESSAKQRNAALESVLKSWVMRFSAHPHSFYQN